ncbi:MAG: hypothetical protein D6690_01800 [Nitrospirae bacterium]|nr:MAG: hypothetical protein D6690_01800 [Nitrospirota bacterium]
MTIQCFICATCLDPVDSRRDAQFHEFYLAEHKKLAQKEDLGLVILQNGCLFATSGLPVLRNPLVKSVAYNWLLCDSNCTADYWVFLPEDCRITARGWATIRRHIKKNKICFALSRDPKVLICRTGIFSQVSEELKILCDMNFLGKEIACVLLRDELARHDFHCISNSWTKVSKSPDRWGNALYEEMNLPNHPDVNKALKLPIFQDYGIDGWKASTAELEQLFLKVVRSGLERQMAVAQQFKGMIAKNGPRITEVPYKGMLRRLRDWVFR